MPELPQWFKLDPTCDLGYLPGMLDINDKRPAREQLHTGYAHGGGWNPFQGFKMYENGNMRYPGDPLMTPLALCQFRNEYIFLYESGWVAIRQLDGSYEVARMD